jgi:hypothetical protein
MLLDPNVSEYNFRPRIQAYDKFKQHLLKLGFTIYPREFDCGNSEHPLVDLAGKMGCNYWAFEYKSESDSISRGVEQVECYEKWFDLVVLVTEKNLDHRTSKDYWRLWRLGVGLWIYDPTSDRCIMKTRPEHQRPDLNHRKLLTRRFNSLSSIRRSEGIPKIPDCDLCSFDSNLASFT